MISRIFMIVKILSKSCVSARRSEWPRCELHIDKFCVPYRSMYVHALRLSPFSLTCPGARSVSNLRTWIIHQKQGRVHKSPRVTVTYLEEAGISTDAVSSCRCGDEPPAHKNRTTNRITLLSGGHCTLKMWTDGRMKIRNLDQGELQHFSVFRKRKEFSFAFSVNSTATHRTGIQPILHILRDRARLTYVTHIQQMDELHASIPRGTHSERILNKIGVYKPAQCAPLFREFLVASQPTMM